MSEATVSFLRMKLKANPGVGAGLATALAWIGVLLLTALQFALAPLCLIPRLKLDKLVSAIGNLRNGLMVSYRDLRVVLEGFYALEDLATVRRGLNELGMFSLVEWLWRRKSIPFQKSEYTSPLQRPYVFFPGLAAQPFYDPAKFSFTKNLEDQFVEIRSELLALLSRKDDFKAYRNELGLYKTPFLKEPDPRVSTYDKGDWKVFYFWVGGQKNEENCRLCPITTAVLESIPELEKYMVCFSMLKGHTRIPKHFGPFNGVLRVHLPLLVPSGCGIRVGDEEREWQEGKVMIFDDSFCHEVWNTSDDIRVVLFVNVFHPAWSLDERRKIGLFINSMFERLPLFRLWQANQITRDEP